MSKHNQSCQPQTASWKKKRNKTIRTEHFFLEYWNWAWQPPREIWLLSSPVTSISSFLWGDVIYLSGVGQDSGERKSQPNCVHLLGLHFLINETIDSVTNTCTLKRLKKKAQGEQEWRDIDLVSSLKHWAPPPRLLTLRPQRRQTPTQHSLNKLINSLTYTLGHFTFWSRWSHTPLCK